MESLTEHGVRHSKSWVLLYHGQAFIELRGWLDKTSRRSEPIFYRASVEYSIETRRHRKTLWIQLLWFFFTSLHLAPLSLITSLNLITRSSEIFVDVPHKEKIMDIAKVQWLNRQRRNTMECFEHYSLDLFALHILVLYFILNSGYKYWITFFFKYNCF